MSAIYLCGRIGEAALADWQTRLQALLPAETVLTRLTAETAAEVDIAVVANPAPGALQGLPQLRFIQSLWAGVEGLLADATLPAELPLARMVDPQMNAAMAETALWAALAVQRGFFRYARQQQAAQWQTWPQRQAAELNVLVLGWGQMGQAVAARLLDHGAVVRAWRAQGGDAGPLAPRVAELGVGADALPALLARSELLINLLPLTPATRGLLDARLFAQLPRGATVVNLARGAHLVDADLLAALENGHLAHAVLDVFATEPLPADHALWRHPAVTVLPHVAAQTDPRSAAAVVAANLQRWRAGRTPEHLVARHRGY